MVGQGLTTGGIALLVLSCGFVLCLLIFCYQRVFRSPEVDQRMHGPLDIDTHDQDT